MSIFTYLTEDTESNKIRDNKYELLQRYQCFDVLQPMFFKYGWGLVCKNNDDSIMYVKPGYETERFEIKIVSTKVIVSVPIRNSIFQYRTSFTSPLDAIGYIKNRFYDFTDNIKQSSCYI